MTFRIPNSAFRILRAFWRLNLAEELQYRANFIASLLGTVFDMATALLTLALFFHHTTALGGWDYWEIVVLLGSTFHCNSAFHTPHSALVTRPPLRTCECPESTRRGTPGSKRRARRSA